MWNRRQRVTLFVGALLCLLVLLFPSYGQPARQSGAVMQEGRAFVFAFKPAPRRERFTTELRVDPSKDPLGLYDPFDPRSQHPGLEIVTIDHGEKKLSWSDGLIHRVRYAIDPLARHKPVTFDNQRTLLELLGIVLLTGLGVAAFRTKDDR